MILKQYLWGAVLIAFLALAGTAGFYKWKSDKQAVDVVLAEQARDDALAEVSIKDEALKAKDKEIEAARVAIEARDQKIREVRRQKEIADANLRKALQDNRAWGNAVIPDSVRDGIKGKTNPSR